MWTVWHIFVSGSGFSYAKMGEFPSRASAVKFRESFPLKASGTRQRYALYGPHGEFVNIRGN